VLIRVVAIVELETPATLPVESREAVTVQRDASGERGGGQNVGRTAGRITGRFVRVTHPPFVTAAKRAAHGRQ
jgi:hypothetical protein